MTGLSRARWLLLFCGVACTNCSDDERPGRFHPFQVGSEGGVESDASGADGPPSPDASGLCGNQIIPALEDRPNLYFVLDRSASMREDLPGSTYNKYLGAWQAITGLLRKVGHRVRYGAAIFPWPDDECSPGRELFAVRGGDPSSYAERGDDGPVLSEFGDALRRAYPADTGGTPTAATIEGLIPNILALEGTTFMVLATDGEPNCNAQATCGVEDCSFNVAGVTINGISCSGSTNCCDPQLFIGGQRSCVDGQATVTAIGALAAAGVKTYVIGMPGSQYYTELLDQMAVAGGTARYAAVANLDELSAAVMSIGVRVAISCTIVLETPPPDRTRVNVYFDRELIPSDPDAGWVFESDGVIQIRGSACDRLMSAAVLQVQVVAGCETVVY